MHTLHHVRLFMESHVFAVWDFMSLLKSLQRTPTCVELPWTPTRSPASRRFINEIVLGEESDLFQGRPISHFELYLEAMQQVQADTRPIQQLINRAGQGIHSQLNQDISGQLDQFVWYLERHIEVDGDDHGPLALKIVADLCGNDPTLWEEAAASAEEALLARVKLWNGVLKHIEESEHADATQSRTPLTRISHHKRFCARIDGAIPSVAALGSDGLVDRDNFWRATTCLVVSESHFGMAPPSRGWVKVDLELVARRSFSSAGHGRLV